VLFLYLFFLSNLCRCKGTENFVHTQEEMKKKRKKKTKIKIPKAKKIFQKLAYMQFL